MDCPECKKNIGFLESLTIINPLRFKCKKCNSYIALNRASIKKYIFILISVFIISLLLFLQVGQEKILSKSFLIFVIPGIMTGVTIIHYFFWKNSSAELKTPNKDDISGLSC